MKRSWIPSLVLLALLGCQRAAETSTDNSTNASKVGLNIGQTALEIKGNDQDGVAFKLSDYRGKVVFLDFWGDW